MRNLYQGILYHLLTSYDATSEFVELFMKKLIKVDLCCGGNEQINISAVSVI